ncbi:hypothetical protein LTR37_000909 [Vermiconidia calcicola]|uniref:Uncharacterized protein n=1 Tax=Vermiconidia calcicola TaxID=1690605 RepID=A0ACC3NXS3_9PEZI|nr:hypothetical protein LTR37_000909 [Vermiconidia calcicola]
MIAPPDMEDAKTETFRLLDLPPELWSQVVKMAVERENYMFSSKDRKQVQQPGITKACKLLRTETLAHSYSHNSFTFRDNNAELAALVAWLKAIGAWNRTRVKNLSIVSIFDDFEEFSQDCYPGLIKVRSSQILDAGHLFAPKRRKYWVEVSKPEESEGSQDYRLREVDLSAAVAWDLGVVEEIGVRGCLKRKRRLLCH